MRAKYIFGSKKRMDSVISKEMGEVFKGPQETGANPYFCQRDHFGCVPLPEEGWKIHVTAGSYKDYVSLLGRLVPALMDARIIFKTAWPSMWEYFADPEKSKGQAGKFITIYPADFSQTRRLPEEIIQLLSSGSGTPVKGELHLGGRVYARYGEFYARAGVYNPATQLVEPDVRGRACPGWISPVRWESIFG